MMDNLSEVEQQIVDVLTIHSPEWKINPDIAIQIGRMHNYTSKILAQLINKGLAESRYVEINGNREAYKEYRLVSTQPISDSGQSAEKAPRNDSESKAESKVDRINRRLSPEGVKSLLERCEKALRGFPENSTEGAKIEVQIKELKQR